MGDSDKSSYEKYSVHLLPSSAMAEPVGKSSSEDKAVSYPLSQPTGQSNVIPSVPAYRCEWRKGQYSGCLVLSKKKQTS